MFTVSNHLPNDYKSFSVISPGFLSHTIIKLIWFILFQYLCYLFSSKQCFSKVVKYAYRNVHKTEKNNIRKQLYISSFVSTTQIKKQFIGSILKFSFVFFPSHIPILGYLQPDFIVITFSIFSMFFVFIPKPAYIVFVMLPH